MKKPSVSYTWSINLIGAYCSIKSAQATKNRETLPRSMEGKVFHWSRGLRLSCIALSFGEAVLFYGSTEEIFSSSENAGYVLLPSTHPQETLTGKLLHQNSWPTALGGRRLIECARLQSWYLTDISGFENITALWKETASIIEGRCRQLLRRSELKWYHWLIFYKLREGESVVIYSGSNMQGWQVISTSTSIRLIWKKFLAADFGCLIVAVRTWSGDSLVGLPPHLWIR
jgi:hypothetical protein